MLEIFRRKIFKCDEDLAAAAGKFQFDAATIKPLIQLAKIEAVESSQNGVSGFLVLFTNFSPGAFVQQIPAGGISEWVEAADINGDSKIDLISANIYTFIHEFSA